MGTDELDIVCARPRGMSSYTRYVTAHPDVFNAALTLPFEERAELAHQLLASLDDPSEDPEVVRAEWDAELVRRLGDVDSGTTKTLSLEEAREQLKP
jgi:putative addiction module component (TIGR02574 family)